MAIILSTSGKKVLAQPDDPEHKDTRFPDLQCFGDFAIKIVQSIKKRITKSLYNVVSDYLNICIFCIRVTCL